MVAVKSAAVAEGHALGDAIDIRGIHHGGFAEAAQALGVFGLGQMAAAGAMAQDFAAGGNLEPLGCGFLGLDAFWTSHKSICSKKERETYQPGSF
jgi:hypothetical protein